VVDKQDVGLHEQGGIARAPDVIFRGWLAAHSAAMAELAKADALARLYPLGSPGAA